MAMVCGCDSNQNDAFGGDDANAAAEDDFIEEPVATEKPEPDETEPVECNWTLEVSDTQTGIVNGYNFTCKLTIMAVKLDGKDATGKYSGLATIEYVYDMQQGDISGNASGGGQDNYAEIEIVAYTVEEPLAPLGVYDATSKGSFIFVGSGDAYESAGDASWSTAESKALEVPYTMEVNGGQVRILLPSIAPDMVFTGIITGTPN
jgi:hypothetical protein